MLMDEDVCASKEKSSKNLLGMQPGKSLFHYNLSSFPPPYVFHPACIFILKNDFDHPKKPLIKCTNQVNVKPIGNESYMLHNYGNCAETVAKFNTE